MSSSAGRLASMSAIRWSSGSANCARTPMRPDGGAPIRRSCWRCRAADRTRFGVSSAYSAPPLTGSRHGSDRSEWCCRRFRILLPKVRERRLRLDHHAARRRRAGREMGGLSQRPCRVGGVRHRHAGTGARRRADGRGLPPARHRGDHRPADPAPGTAAKRHPGQSRHRRERRPGTVAGGMHAGTAGRRARAAVFRHAGAAPADRGVRSASTGSWRLAASAPSAKAADIVLDVAPRHGRDKAGNEPCRRVNRPPRRAYHGRKHPAKPHPSSPARRVTPKHPA